MPRLVCTADSLRSSSFVSFWILLLLTAHRCTHAQRTRVTFGSFQLRFVDNDASSSCGGNGGAWDATAEAVRSGAEACLRTVQCHDFSDRTPFFVGLGNVQCGVVTDDEEDEEDGQSILAIDFVGGGAMDFDTDVPHDPSTVERCVWTVLQSSECVKIYASYNARITSPATFTVLEGTTTWRSYPTVILAPSGGDSSSGTSVADNNVHSSKEEDHVTHSGAVAANNMSRPFSAVSGACSAAVVLAFVVAFFLYHRKRRRHGRGRIEKKNNLSTTAFDLEEAGGGETGGGDLAKADGLAVVRRQKSCGELARMLDDEWSAAAAKNDRDDTPTTTKEADASFETTSSTSCEVEEDEDGNDEDENAVEVGLSCSFFTSTATDGGPYVADGSTDKYNEVPLILIPKRPTTTAAFVDDDGPGRSLRPPSSVGKSRDHGHGPVETTTATPSQKMAGAYLHTPTRENDPTGDNGLVKAASLTDVLPELGQSSDDNNALTSGSDDSLLVDLQTRFTTDYEHNYFTSNESSSMVEITSDQYESTMRTNETDDDDDPSTSSSSELDREFEPDAYWDPDDNSISTADAAGLFAMGTGEFSFQPTTSTTITGTSSSLSTSAPNNDKNSDIRRANEMPPPPSCNWFCHGPALCSTSTSSLPSLAKLERGSEDRPVRQRTKSFCGGGSHQS